MEAHCSSTLGNDDQQDMPLRERLSHMSLEELKQLKEKLGTRIFDEAMFGSQKSKKKSNPHKTQYMRLQELSMGGHGNLPLEMSSKIRPSRILPAVKPIKKPHSIDPRFDPIYGVFTPEEFSDSYSFIDEKKKEELLLLKEQLKTAEGIEWKKCDFVIKKVENELREVERLKEKKLDAEKRHEKLKRALKNGQRPDYYNKSELRAVELVKKFERMKKEDKLERCIEKQRKKNASKGRKKVDVLGLGNN